MIELNGTFKENVEKIKSLDDIELNIKMKIQPFNYQKVGAFFMWYVKKCFILDDAGMGKTIESLTYIKLLQKSLNKLDVKILIVATSNLLYQWETECKKFTNLLPVVVDSQTKNARHNIYKSFVDDKRNLLIINYSKLQWDFDYISKTHYDAIIFDEASALKDNTTKQYKFADYLTQKVDRVVMLTATPISNNIEEFYNLFCLFHQNFLPPRNEFQERFLELKRVKIKGRNGREFYKDIPAGSKISMIPVFREMVEPYYIRRLNNSKDSEFSNLKMNIMQIPVYLTHEQKDLCKSLKINHLMDEDAVLLKLFSDFIKVACCPQIYDQSFSNISPKAIELIKEIKRTDKKYVVYAKFIEFHKILHSYLTKAGIKFVSVTGLQSSKEKDQSKKDFYEDPEVKVILLTGAGKFGLNLQITNKLVFMDLPYTPSDVFQIIGRIFRTGQKEDVDVLMLYNKDSLEEDLFDNLLRKQTEIDTFFEQDKADIFLLKDKDKVNVRNSFIERNYGVGPYYDDLWKKEDYDLVPEKEVLIIEEESDDYFEKLLNVDL